MIAPVITNCLNDVALALTPVERWNALSNNNHNPMTDRWFMVTGIVAIVILSILFFVINIKRVRYERKGSNKLFDEYSVKSGLSQQETQLLFEIAKNAGLKRNESIFTMVTAFDRGALVLRKGFSGNHQSPEYSHMKVTISSLREKLGFTKKASFSRGAPNKSTQLISKDIPVGKKVTITRRSGRNTDGIDAVVVANTESELEVELGDPIKITFGEFWCVRYFQGSSIWEFDSSVHSYDGSRLILSHNDNVRFINRRRFLRVPVVMSAFIAAFPFERLCDESKRDDLDEDGFQQTQALIWGPPEFIPALVTELAGPGLRIETSLDVKVGDRVLVVFNLGQQKEVDSNRRSARLVPYSIAEDIGTVRHISNIENGLSIAIELTGLNDSNINKLICAANTTSRETASSNEAVTV